MKSISADVMANFLRFDSEDEPEPIPFQYNGVDSPVDELDLKLLKHRSSPVSALPQTMTQLPTTIQRQDPPMTLEQLHVLMTRNRTRTSLMKKELACAFCKNNGEASFIYTSHKLKDDEDRILCPILREYTCPNCGASGDNAHTLKYCPLSGAEAMGVGSLRTARTSTGRKRTPRNVTPERFGRRPPPSQLLTADKFQKVIGPLL